MQCNAVVRGRDESALSDHSDDNETESFFLRCAGHDRRPTTMTTVLGKEKLFEWWSRDIDYVWNSFPRCVQVESFSALSFISTAGGKKVFISSWWESFKCEKNSSVRDDRKSARNGNGYCRSPHEKFIHDEKWKMIILLRIHRIACAYNRKKSFSTPPGRRVSYSWKSLVYNFFMSNFYTSHDIIWNDVLVRSSVKKKLSPINCSDDRAAQAYPILSISFRNSQFQK